MNKKPPFQIGDKASSSRVITAEDIDSFANLVGDHNPIHLNDLYAKGTFFRGRIAHGIMCLGLISAVLGNQLPGPGTIYLNQTARFLIPVRPADTITAKVEITQIKHDEKKYIITLHTICVNQRGQIVIDGEAVCQLVDEL